MRIIPDKDLVKNHKVPNWFHDAKFGIFIHWGLYSVPAFAKSKFDLVESLKQELEEHYANNPYAEWYLNTLRIPNSPTKKYHAENYGDDFKYEDFAEIFNREIVKWKPEEMAKLFKLSGAKYAVLTTKHHDGFLLWPSKYPNPIKGEYHACRDIVGELTRAVRKQGLKMGLYYSGVFDWTFVQHPIKDNASEVTNFNKSPEYIEYANNHWYELVDFYEPVILWNDIGYPVNTDLHELFTYFYRKIPEGLVNDRWLQVKRKGDKFPMCRHYDFTTPEYETYDRITSKKWETNRGIGNSYGYNKYENPENFLTGTEAIHMLVDIVSKNGNLLLNVGPRPDGSIQDEQKNCLLEIGKWLQVNGEAIYGTRPWIRFDSKTSEGVDVRFTKKVNTLYVIILNSEFEGSIELNDLALADGSIVQLLGVEGQLDWKQKNKNVVINLPKITHLSHAISFKIYPLPIDD